MQYLEKKNTQGKLYYKNKSNKLFIIIAKLYIYLLPIRMIAPLSFLKVYLKGAAAYFDLILHSIGFLLIILASKGFISIGKDKTSKLFHYFAWMILWFNLSSFFMAIIMQAVYGNIGNETAFDGISGMLIYFTQYALMVFYNKEIFKVISKEEIISIFKRLMIFLLILGYFQIAVMNFGGIFAAIYDSLNWFDVLHSSRMPKLCLTAAEGSGAGVLISTFVFPFILSRILVEKRSYKGYILLILWLPILYFTYSSTAYIITSIVVSVFIIINLFRLKSSKKSMIFVPLVSMLLVLGIIFSSKINNILPEEVSNKISYLLLEKATDKINGSTVSRTIPLLVNWGAFKEYPIIGVGNGNQGYFYEKYFPSYAYNVAGSDATVFLERSKTGISNGGVFIPSLLSGYGIIGVTILVVYIIKCVHHVKRNKKELESFYYMFFISWIAILFSGVQGDFIGSYYIWFLLSIPYITAYNYNLEKDRG